MGKTQRFSTDGMIERKVGVKMLPLTRNHNKVKTIRARKMSGKIWKNAQKLCFAMLFCIPRKEITWQCGNVAISLRVTVLHLQRIMCISLNPGRNLLILV